MRRASKTVAARTKDRLGRTIVLEQKTMDKLIERVDRDLEGREPAIMRAVEDPDERRPGNRPGTEVVYKKGLSRRARWLAVVVEYHGLLGTVLTAYPLSELPKTNE